MQTQCRRNRYDFKSHPITADHVPFVHKESRVLTIGSCFAYEIRGYLIANGYHVLNQSMPKQLLWYNTATILYEFERVNGDFAQDIDDYWHVNDDGQRNSGLYQDPYRRLVFAESPVMLKQIVDGIDAQMDAYIREADVIVITLGMTENWLNKRNGKTICACPRYGKGAGYDATFEMTRYHENHYNIATAMEILHEVNPSAQVILTVSPVAIAATFRNIDHLIANTESKSILRAVAGEVAAEFDFVHYFHSYELALNTQDSFCWDGRHVAKDFVSGVVMPDFEKHFLAE